MVKKHRLQKLTSVIGIPTKWKVFPKIDEIMGNSGTATAVRAVPLAAPLVMVMEVIEIMIFFYSS